MRFWVFELFQCKGVGLEVDAPQLSLGGTVILLTLVRSIWYTTGQYYHPSVCL